jgi:hypothetical protein
MWRAALQTREHMSGDQAESVCDIVPGSDVFTGADAGIRSLAYTSAATTVRADRVYAPLESKTAASE